MLIEESPTAEVGYYRRLPEARHELTLLNDALDDMLQEIRLAIPKLPMSTYNTESFYDGSVTGMEI